MMDAVKFIKERQRLCDWNDTCAECPLRNSPCGIDHIVDPELYVSLIEKWSEENPEVEK